MAISVVQTASGSGASPVTVTFGSNTTAGNCVIVTANNLHVPTAGNVSNITLGGAVGNFASLNSIQNGGVSANIYADPNCAGGQTAVSVSFTVAGSSCYVVAYEVAGLPTVSPLDKTATNSGDSSAFSSSATATTTDAYEIWVGTAISSSGNITGPISPWTNNTGAGTNTVSGYQLTSATGAATYAGGIASTSGWAAIIVTLKHAVGTDSGAFNITLPRLKTQLIGGKWPVQVVNGWSVTATQPAAFGTNPPPILQSTVLPLNSTTSVGPGNGTPTAGNWLFAIAGWNQSSLPAATVAVADDIRSFWRPGEVVTGSWPGNIPSGAAGVSAPSGNTRTAVWYTPNIVRAPLDTYIAPNGIMAGMAVLVIEVAGLGPWDTTTGVYSNYAAAATSLNLALGAPSANAFMLAAFTGDNNANGQAFAPAGWTTLPTVTSSNGSDHTCDAEVTSAWIYTNGSVSVNGTATTAIDLSGTIVGVLATAPTPVPATQNLNWPYAKFEAAFGGGFQTPPDQLIWTDLTSRAWSWDETTGIQYQLGQVQATELNLELDNFDGNLSSDWPGSLYYSNALNSNMSFQSGVSPWSAANSATLAQSSTYAYASSGGATATYSLSATPNGSTAGPGATSERVTVTVGSLYSASAWFYSPGGWTTGATMVLSWYSTAGTFISSQTSSTTAIPAATWTQAAYTGQTAPTSAATCTITPSFSGTPAANPFYVAEAALAAGSSAVATGLVTTGTPLRLRSAIGTLGGVTENRWYVVSRNAEKWAQQVTSSDLRRYVPVTATDIWSIMSATCATPYRGEVYEDSPYAWWPCDDKLTIIGLPTSLNNIARGNTNALNIVLSPGGGIVQFYYDQNGTSTQGFAGSPVGIAIYTVDADSGWMPGDPVAFTGAFTASGNPESASPGSAAWQASGQAGITGSYGYFLSCNDSNFPGLSGGVTVEGWFNCLFYGSGTGTNPGSTSDIGVSVTSQPESVPITLFELATGSNPVAKLQLNTSGHMTFTTYNGAAATSNNIYTTSDLRGESWMHVAVTLTTTTWAVYVNGGATAAVSGTATGMTSAWTWLIVNGDFAANGGSAAGTGLVNGANMSVSHLAVYPSQLPAWRIRSHYWAAITGFGLLPAPTGVTITWVGTSAARNSFGTTPITVPDLFAPDGTADLGTYNAGHGVAVCAIVTSTTPGGITSGPSAWVAQAATTIAASHNSQTLWISWTAVAPSNKLYTSQTQGNEAEAAVVCGSGDSFTSHFGGNAAGLGVCQTAAGDGSAPVTAATSIGDTVGQRIERILGYGLVNAPTRCVDPAPLLVQGALDVGGQQAGENITNIRQSDSGLLFVDNLGNLTYWQKSHLAAQTAVWTITPNAPPTVGASATAVPYDRNVNWQADPQHVYTAITTIPYSPTGAQLPLLTPVNSAAVLAAQKQYGAQPLQLTSYLQSPAEQQTQLNWLFTEFGTLRIRVAEVKIEAASYPAAFPLVLGVNIGDLVSVQNWVIGNTGITETFRVTRIHRHVEFGGQSGIVSGSVELELDPEPASYWS